MKRYLFISLVIFSASLPACGNVAGINLGPYAEPDASPAQFSVCHGYGCSHQTITNFTPNQWRKVGALFKPAPKSSQDELIKIGEAIAMMEKYVGQTAGTQDDLPKAPLKRQSTTELDCIDETVNTTKYLRFLEQDGLLKFYKVGQPVYKGYFINGVYPHNSATVQEIETGKIYAIDSYIHANGELPNIRPLESWLRYRAEELEDAHNLNAVTLDNL